METEAVHAETDGAASILRQAYRAFDACPDLHDARGPAAGGPAVAARPGVDGIDGAAARGWFQDALGLPASVVDRVTLRLMEPFFVSGGRPDLSGDLRQRIRDGQARYGSPELLARPSAFFRRPSGGRDRPPIRVRRISRLPRGARLRLTWVSAYRTFDPSYEPVYRSYSGNEVARAHVWLHDDARRPVVVCAHCWCSGYLPLDERVFAAGMLYRQGWNVALLTSPFHGSRTPHRALFPGRFFPSRNVPRTNEAFGQAVFDFRTLFAWLREEHGAGPIGMQGFSLGGYTTSLMASLEPDLAFAIPIGAPSTFADLLWYHGQGGRHRREIESLGVGLPDIRALLSVHSPLVHRLAIPRERVLIVWGRSDRIVPSVHQVALWEHWGRPEICSFPGGHMLHLGRAGYLRRVVAWIRGAVG